MYLVPRPNTFLIKRHIDTRFLISDNDNPSGVALINVDENGENSIVVASGSNGTLSAYDINEDVFKTKPDDIFLMQLEIPVGTVEYVAQKACRQWEQGHS